MTEIRDFLSDWVELALARGVPAERIVIDPGHDLNKNTRHSLEITRRLAELADLGLPVLAARVQQGLHRRVGRPGAR